MQRMKTSWSSMHGFGWSTKSCLLRSAQTFPTLLNTHPQAPSDILLNNESSWVSHYTTESCAFTALTCREGTMTNATATRHELVSIRHTRYSISSCSSSRCCAGGGSFWCTCGLVGLSSLWTCSRIAQMGRRNKEPESNLPSRS